jgi:peptidoglycan/LPS O-acetylase OafA/YrhL
MKDALWAGYGLAMLAIAFGVASVLLAKSRFAVGAAGSRNLALDGLRGYLALGVLVHHAALWFVFARTKQWGELPVSSAYARLGEQCVAVFFMITAFLFTTKLLHAKSAGRGPGWLRLYSSRVLRITPLYACVVAVLLLLVAWSSGFQLRVAPGELLSEIGAWLVFGMTSLPAINGVSAGLMVAWVVWSLAYEWLFYLSLPLLALVLRVPVSWRTLVICTVLLSLGLAFKENLFFPSAFVSGAAAAALVRQSRLSAWARTPLASVVALGFVLAVLNASASWPRSVTLLGLSGVFFAVVSGNTLFGLLSNRAALLLGDISYGIYLLHGLTLYVLFELVLGRAVVAQLSALQHWLAVAAAVIVTVLLAWLSYCRMEMPALRHVPVLVSWLHALNRRPGVRQA